MPEEDWPALSTVDWDVPVTEEFVARVHGGVRRRRLRRRVLVGGCAALAVAGLVLAGTRLPRPVTGPPVAPPPTVASGTGSPTAVAVTLDGFVLGYLPAGATRVEPDSFYVAAVGPQGLANDGSAPAPGQPSATVRIRAFTSREVSSIFVSVLRPVPGAGVTVPAAQVTSWLTGWALGSAPRIGPLPVPAGQAYLLDDAGSEGTTHRLVIAAGDGAVIVVEGSGSLSVEELRRVAAGVAPA